MKSLKVLDLDDNGIKELPSGFDASTELEELYLSHNKITYIPDTIFELKGLKAFFILDNQIETTLPSAIGQLTLLEELDLEMNYFTGTIPDELYELTSLRKLWLFGNMFTGKFSPKFSAMSRLNVLDLTQNYITGELPPDIGLFDNITELHLKQNMITGQIPSELSALTTLTVLDISMNLLDSTLISGIGELENLVTLRLDNNYRLDMNGTLLSYGIKGSIPSSLGSLKQLSKFRINEHLVILTAH
jgi:Leucine-rich repeat (LRR) protein